MSHFSLMSLLIFKRANQIPINFKHTLNFLLKYLGRDNESWTEPKSCKAVGRDECTCPGQDKYKIVKTQWSRNIAKVF